MQIDAINEAAEEFAETIVADIPGSPAEVEKIISQDVEMLVQERQELPTEGEPVTDILLDELMNGVDSLDDTVSDFSVLLSSRLSEEVD